MYQKTKDLLKAIYNLLEQCESVEDAKNAIAALARVEGLELGEPDPAPKE